MSRKVVFLRALYAILAVLMVALLLMFSILYMTGEELVDISVAMVEEGVEVEKIVGGSAKGIDASSYGVDNEKAIVAQRKRQSQLIKDVVDYDLKAKVVGIKAGSKIGEIHDIKVTGVDVKADSSNSSVKNLEKLYLKDGEVLEGVSSLVTKARRKKDKVISEPQQQTAAALVESKAAVRDIKDAQVIGHQNIYVTQEGIVKNDDNQDKLLENRTKKIIFNLPPRNRKFIGRGDALTKIKKQLNEQKFGVITQTISGAGGIGKTQLASEFAYRAVEKKEYSVIFWVPAETVNSINHAYREFAELLQIDIKGFGYNEIKLLVHRKLAEKYKGSKILFILDNVSGYEKIREYIQELNKQLLTDFTLHILITSRSQHWPEKPLILDIFTSQEALAFAKKHLPSENEKSLAKLTEALHYYPLALNQAVAYIKQHINIDDYLTLYMAKKRDYLNRFSGDRNQYTESLWKTWHIALSKLSNIAKEILFVSSYLYPDDIPIAFFDNLSVEKRGEAINELRKHSFINLINSKSFKIHRLLQEVIRTALVANGDSNIGMKKIILSKAVSLLKAKFNFSYAEFNKRDLYIQYLTHVKFLAEYLLNNSKNNSFHVSGIQLYAQLAMYLTYVNRDYMYAQKTWEKISGFIRQYYSNEESKLILANINMHLTFVTRTEGEAKNKQYAEEAVSFYRAMAKSMKISSEIDKLLPYFRWSRNLVSYNGIISDQSFTLFCLGISMLDNTSVQDSMMDWQIAENYLKEALNLLLDKNEAGNNLIKMALFNFLGKLYLLQRDIKKAKKMLNSAKLLAEKNFPDHLETAYIYERLAGLQYHVGDYGEAIENLKKCLKIRLSILSKDHYRIGFTKNILGLILCANNSIKEGIKNLQEAEAIYENLHSKVLKQFNVVLYLGMSNAFEMNKDYDKALQYLIKVRDVIKKYSEHGVYALISYHFPISEKFPALKASEKNIDYYTKVLDIVKTLFGENHIRVARYHYLLGQIFKNVRNKSQARKHYQKALEIANKQHFDDEILIVGHQKNIRIIQEALDGL